MVMVTVLRAKNGSAGWAAASAVASSAAAMARLRPVGRESIKQHTRFVETQMMSVHRSHKHQPARTRSWVDRRLACRGTGHGERLISRCGLVPGRQEYACHVKAGRTFVGDKPRLLLEGRNPCHLMHRGLATRTRFYFSYGLKVRHEQPLSHHIHNTGNERFVSSLYTLDFPARFSPLCRSDNIWVATGSIPRQHA